MTIWFDKNITVESLQSLGKGTMSDHLGIEFIELGKDFIIARMPVDGRTKQPHGLLHGGASCVLAETVGSVASYKVIDSSKFYCVGIEINANHIRSAKEGFVYCKVMPLHLGSTTHVWDIRITDEKEKLICVCRLTVVIIKKKDQTEVENPASSTS
jgi:1,4-dihydroxy-2-naphthoyl-CoA hydrolase